MTPEERIIALERELAETRRSAVTIIVGMASAMAETAQEREELAQTFEEFAQEADHVMSRLARMVAGAIRR